MCKIFFHDPGERKKIADPVRDSRTCDETARIEREFGADDENDLAVFGSLAQFFKFLSAICDVGQCLRPCAVDEPRRKPHVQPLVDSKPSNSKQRCKIGPVNFHCIRMKFFTDNVKIEVDLFKGGLDNSLARDAVIQAYVVVNTVVVHKFESIDQSLVL